MNNTMNPYAAPRAPVADVDAREHGVQPVKLFSARGRVGRLRYFSYSIAGYLVTGIAAFVLSISMAAAGQSAAIGVLTLIPYFIFIVLLTLQRSHDMNWTGWTAPLAFIPVVGLVWLFKSGTQGVNRFGSPPPPNTLSVKILAWILPGIAFVGIVAAIALPAYQQYVQRAKAAQLVKP